MSRKGQEWVNCLSIQPTRRPEPILDGTHALGQRCPWDKTEFLLGLEVIDPLLKKKQSVNVIGTLRKPGTTNVKRLLILSGHHDSAPENVCLRFLNFVNRQILQRGRRDSAGESFSFLAMALSIFCATGCPAFAGHDKRGADPVEAATNQHRASP